MCKIWLHSIPCIYKSHMNSICGKSNKLRTLLICLALLTTILAVFWQTGTHEFINLDDVPYVIGNPQVKAGLSRAAIVWAFTATTEANWHPLTWLSHMADCQLFGLDPAGHHLISVLLHTANSLLLFLLLLRVTGRHWQSAFVSALFALHPLHVESVAWVAERKDVLSTLFWLLTMLAYAGYVSRPVLRRYLSTLLLFSLGLMAKPMLVTLPLVLLLLDFWPLGRWQPATIGILPADQPRSTVLYRLVLEKVPFLVLSFVSSVITYLVQHKDGAVVTLTLVPIRLRIENAFVSYVRYLGKMIWPTRLAIFYPFQFNLPLWQVAGSILLLVVVALLELRQWRNYPYLTVGWFWYLITLVPVIGFVQVGSQSMADRYTYVPLIGIFIALAWGVPEFLKDCRWRVGILTMSAAIILTVFALVTYKQLGYWQDSITLYNHSLMVTPPNRFLQDNLASAYLQRGSLDEAIEQGKVALKLDTDDFTAHFIMGLVYDKKGETPAAIYHYSEAVRIKPAYIVALNNLGRDLAIAGDYEKARACFIEVLRLDPDDRNARYNLNFIAGKVGQ